MEAFAIAGKQTHYHMKMRIGFAPETQWTAFTMGLTVCVLLVCGLIVFPMVAAVWFGPRTSWSTIIVRPRLSRPSTTNTAGQPDAEFPGIISDSVQHIVRTSHALPWVPTVLPKMALHRHLFAVVAPRLHGYSLSLMSTDYIERTDTAQLRNFSPLYSVTSYRIGRNHATSIVMFERNQHCDSNPRVTRHLVHLDKHAVAVVALYQGLAELRWITGFTEVCVNVVGGLNSEQPTFASAVQLGRRIQHWVEELNWPQRFSLLELIISQDSHRTNFSMATDDGLVSLISDHAAVHEVLASIASLRVAKVSR